MIVDNKSSKVKTLEPMFIQNKIENLDKYIKYMQLLSDTIHTRGESLQEGLGVVRTYGMTLASAYMLCHLSAMQSQLQKQEEVQEGSEY